jgi:hypothetical protein
MNKLENKQFNIAKVVVEDLKNDIANKSRK